METFCFSNLMLNICCHSTPYNKTMTYFKSLVQQVTIGILHQINGRSKYAQICKDKVEASMV